MYLEVVYINYLLHGCYKVKVILDGTWYKNNKNLIIMQMNTMKHDTKFNY